MVIYKLVYCWYEQAKPEKYRLLRPGQAGGAVVARRHELPVPHPLLGRHVHAQQTHHLALHLLHHLHFLQTEERLFHPPVFDQPYDDHFRAGDHLYDAASWVTFPYLICMLYNTAFAFATKEAYICLICSSFRQANSKLREIYNKN